METVDDVGELMLSKETTDGPIIYSLVKVCGLRSQNTHVVSTQQTHKKKQNYSRSAPTPTPQKGWIDLVAWGLMSPQNIVDIPEK
jgi:hypothetical protein